MNQDQNKMQGHGLMANLIAMGALLFCLFPVAWGQQDMTLYNMRNVPQSMYSNPALIPQARVNIGLPFISSNYFSLSNSGFRYNDMIQKRSDDSLTLNMDNMISKLRRRNFLVSNFRTDIFSLGIVVKKNYFSFNVSERYEYGFTYPKDLIQLIWEGNGSETFLGKRANMDGLALDFSHFRETAFGFAREINEQLTLGIKVKRLYGMENIWTEESTLGLHTDEETFDLTVDGNMIINTSGITPDDDFRYLNEDPAHYLFGRPNNGLGMDIGGEYHFDDRITLNASLIDLGFINWRYNTRNYTNDDIAFEFKGVDLNAVASANDTTLDAVMDALNDSLRGTFDFEETANGYRTGLITRIHLGGTYKLNKESSVGALIHTSFYRKRVRPGLALSYNYQKKWLNASFTYSAFNRAFLNLGAGVSANLGPVQFFLVTDNLLAPIVPHLTRNAHVHLGINLTFGRKPLDRDEDGVSDRKDECPDTPGLAQYNGCPDTDNDGIPDRLDDCPTVWGLSECNGCPDTDGDGICDLADDCIDVPGLADFNGCPDSDEDGIADQKDECPEVAGIPEFNGCPDTDEDSIPDHKDECPAVAGTPEFFGCPPTQLILVDRDGNRITVAKRNREGIFVFEELPSDKHMMFMMEGEDNFLMDELLILLKSEGEETLITATKDASKKFDYEYLPTIDRSIALLVLDEEGNVLRKTFRNKDGSFVFENLPPDEHYLFQLEGEDLEMPDELKIMIQNDDHTYMMTIPREAEEEGFQYEFLPSEQSRLAIIDDVRGNKLVMMDLEEEEVVKKAFEHLEFNFSSAVINQQSYGPLDELADLLNKKPKWKIKVSGHTDNVGSEITNLALSKRRAESIKRYLMEKGIEGDRIIVKYYGHSQPIAPNDTEEGRQKNRRVELLIVE